MPVFNFQLCGNEDIMLRVAFPAEHDIYLNHLQRSEDLKQKREAFSQFYRFDVPVSRLVKTALSYADNRVVRPTDFVRKLDQDDKKTDDSNNWPDPDCKYGVRLDDAQFKKLGDLADRYFLGNKTYTVVWALRNFSAQLADDTSLLTSTYRANRLSNTNSKQMTIRLPHNVLAFYDRIRGNDSLGKAVREAVLQDYERQVGEMGDYARRGDFKTIEPVEDDFDYDLDV